MELQECELCNKMLHTGENGLIGTCLNPDCRLIRLSMERNLRQLKSQMWRKRLDEKTQLDIIRESEPLNFLCIVCSKHLTKAQVKNRNKTCSAKCMGRRALHLKKRRWEMFETSGVILTRDYADAIRTYKRKN